MRFVHRFCWLLVGLQLLVAGVANADYFVTLRPSVDPDDPQIPAADLPSGGIFRVSDSGFVSPVLFANPASLDGPSGLALLGSDLYVANTFNDEIVKYNISSPVPTLGTPVVGAADGIDQATALRFDSANNLYAANSGFYAGGNVLPGTTVSKITLGPTPTATNFGLGHNGPNGISIDASNNVLVSEYGESFAGTAVRTFAPNGTDITNATPPTGIAGSAGTAFNGGDLLIPGLFDNAVYTYDGTTTTKLFAFSDFAGDPGDIFGLYNSPVFIFPSVIYTVDSDTILVGASAIGMIFKYDYPTGGPATLSYFAVLGGGFTAIGDIIAVPEPSTVTLLGMCLLALVRAGRRRRQVSA